LGKVNFNGTIGVRDAGLAGAMATLLAGAFRAGAALAASIVAASTTEDRAAAILIWIGLRNLFSFPFVRLVTSSYFKAVTLTQRCRRSFAHNAASPESAIINSVRFRTESFFNIG
jgi:hypothetical protein